MPRGFLSIIVLLTITPSAERVRADDTYLEQIKPILKTRCYACHGSLKQEAGVRLDTAASIKQLTDDGQTLLTRVASKDTELRMPPEGAPLTPGQIEAIRHWISQGAPAPKTEAPDQSADLQRREFALIDRLNRLTLNDYKSDQQLLARIKSYELAFRMQESLPDAVDFTHETQATHSLYGLDNDVTAPAAQKLLAARRLVERGVRFVQVFPTPYGKWDAHRDLKKNHTDNSAKVDLPVAGLIADLKQRGLLDETLVVLCTEFGRTPGLEERSGGTTGRDHHPNGFTILMAGGGTKGGYVHGATDELGYHALGDAHYVTDLHATVLHALGLKSEKLDVNGRKRLEIDHGEPIWDIFS